MTDERYFLPTCITFGGEKGRYAVSNLRNLALPPFQVRPRSAAFSSPQGLQLLEGQGHVANGRHVSERPNERLGLVAAAFRDPRRSTPPGVFRVQLGQPRRDIGSKQAFRIVP